MPRITIKRPLTTEKTFNHQDKGTWSFQVDKSANKIEIKQALELMFGVKINSVNTFLQQKKVRQLRGSRVHTKRPTQKIARVTLKDKKQKIDLTKLKK